MKLEQGESWSPMKQWPNLEKEAFVYKNFQKQIENDLKKYF